MESYKKRMYRAAKAIRQEIADEIIVQFGQLAATYGFHTSRIEFNMEWEQLVVDFLATPIDGITETFTIVCDTESTRFDAYHGEAAGTNLSEPINELYGQPALTWPVLCKRAEKFITNLKITCPDCEGDGETYENEDDDRVTTCPRCDGTGMVLRNELRRAA